MVKSNLSLSKKGNLFDVFSVAELMLVAVVMGFLLYITLTHFSSGIDQIDTGSNYTSFIENARDKTGTSIDWAVLLFLIAAMIFSIIMAQKLPTEPLYIAIVLILSVVFFIISMLISNVFGGLMDNSQINTYVLTTLPITNVLLQYFPFIAAFYIGAVMIAFFGKDRT